MQEIHISSHFQYQIMHTCKEFNTLISRFTASIGSLKAIPFHQIYLFILKNPNFAAYQDNLQKTVIVKCHKMNSHIARYECMSTMQFYLNLDHTIPDRCSCANFAAYLAINLCSSSLALSKLLAVDLLSRLPIPS